MSKNDTTTIRGWVARENVDNSLFLFQNPPKRVGDVWLDFKSHFSNFFIIPPSLFPEITWESEPVEVEITIKKIEK